MVHFDPSLFPAFPKLTITAIFDIFVVAVLIYQFIQIVRGRRSAHIIGGLVVVAFAYGAAILFGLELLRTILATLAPYTAFALIVMFQSELRRMLARLGRRRFLGLGGSLERRELNDEILLAVSQLSQDRIGALIVLERNIGLRTFVESGVALDAYVSRDLICSIFQPLGALHDGAVVIQNGRIAAAACFLPLTTTPQQNGDLGTRHRAAIGVTEEADCVSLVVSEETGQISIAAFGEIEMGVTLQRAEQRLHDVNEPPTDPRPQLSPALERERLHRS